MKTFKLIHLKTNEISELSHTGSGYFWSRRPGKNTFVGKTQRAVRRFLKRKELDLAPRENLDVMRRNPG